MKTGQNREIVLFIEGDIIHPRDDIYVVRANFPGNQIAFVMGVANGYFRRCG